jgi:hypothetical protein
VAHALAQGLAVDTGISFVGDRENRDGH